MVRTFILGNHCEIDKTIEEIMIKHVDSKGGSGGSRSGLFRILNMTLVKDGLTPVINDKKCTGNNG